MESFIATFMYGAFLGLDIQTAWQVKHLSNTKYLWLEKSYYGSIQIQAKQHSVWHNEPRDNTIRRLINILFLIPKLSVN